MQLSAICASRIASSRRSIACWRPQGESLLVQTLTDRAKVYVNGERIEGEHRLQNNDTLRIGKTTIRLVL